MAIVSKLIAVKKKGENDEKIYIAYDKLEENQRIDSIFEVSGDYPKFYTIVDLLWIHNAISDEEIKELDELEEVKDEIYYKYHQIAYEIVLKSREEIELVKQNEKYLDFEKQVIFNVKRYGNLFKKLGDLIGLDIEKSDAAVATKKQILSFFEANKKEEEKEENKKVIHFSEWEKELMKYPEEEYFFIFTNR